MHNEWDNLVVEAGRVSRHRRMVDCAYRRCLLADFRQAWMTVAWFVWLAILNAKPDWLLRLWGGGDLDFSTIRTIVLCFFTAFKLLLFVLVIMTIWLSFWARQISRVS